MSRPNEEMSRDEVRDDGGALQRLHASWNRRRGGNAEVCAPPNPRLSNRHARAVTNRASAPQHTILDALWVSTLIDEARSVCAPTERCIDPLRLSCGIEILTARGPIAPHVDHEFANRPWSYLLILRAREATLRSHRHTDLSLTAGMLVELYVLQRHSLRQLVGESFMWLPLDSGQRLSLTDAALHLHDRAKAWTPVPDGMRLRSDAATSWDGQTVWVNGPDGGCIGRFGRNGVDIHFDSATQITLGRQCMACTHGRPSPEDWDRFVEHMAGVGATVPKAARPRWLPLSAFCHTGS